MSKPTVAAFVFFSFLLGIVAALSFGSWRNTTFVLSPQAAQNDVQKLVVRVGRLIALPTDEQPTIATVTDPEKLRDQPFFAQAKKGYNVLLYAHARKAILYDPDADRIVEVAPLNVGSAATTSPTPQVPESSPASTSSSTNPKK